MSVVLCYGDSNTHGYDPSVLTGGRFPRDVRWPGVLVVALGAGWDVIEEGLNGRTTIWDDPFHPGRNGLPYLGPCLETHAPVDVVVIMLGTNDTKTIFGRTAAEIASGAGTLVDTVLRSAAGPAGAPPKVLLVAPAAPGDATERSELWGFGDARAKGLMMGRLYATAAAIRGVAFLDAGPLAQLDPADGVHLTPAGHAALGGAVAEAIRSLV
jgi:lysophospholipase L1-like esterase